MEFTPDLLVPSPEGTSYDLVVEVKTGATSEAAVRQLARYMIGMPAPWVPS